MRGNGVCKRSPPAAGVRTGCRRLLGVVGLALALFGCAAPPAAPFPPGVASLRVTLTGLRNDRGHVIVSLFPGGGGFPREIGAATATLTVPIVAGEAQALFTGIPYGEYAASALHDEDDDGEMASGVFGAPREGFGFSGQPDYRFGPPRFAEVSFLLLAPQQELAIAMRYDTARRQHQDQGRARESRQSPQE